MFWVFCACVVSKSYCVDLSSSSVQVAEKEIGMKTVYLSEKIPNVVGFQGNLDGRQLLNLSNWVIGKDAVNCSNVIYKPFMRVGAKTAAAEVMSAAFLVKLLPNLKSRDDVTVIVPTEIPTESRVRIWQIFREMGVRAQLMNTMTALAMYFAHKVNNRTGKFRVLCIDSGFSKSELFTVDVEYVNHTYSLLHDRWMWSQVSGSVVDSLISTGLSAQLNSTIPMETVESARLSIGDNESIEVDGMSVNFTQNDINYFAKRSFAELEHVLDNFEAPDIVYMVGGASRFNRFYNIIQNTFPNATIHLEENENVLVDAGLLPQPGPRAVNFTSYTWFSPLTMNITVGTNTTSLFRVGEKLEDARLVLPVNETMTVTTDHKSVSLNYSFVIDEMLNDNYWVAQSPLTLNFGRSQELDCPDLQTVELDILTREKVGNQTISKAVREEVGIDISVLDVLHELTPLAKQCLESFQRQQHDSAHNESLRQEFNETVDILRTLFTSDVEFRNVSTESERMTLIEELEKASLNEDEDLDDQLDALMDQYHSIFFRYHEALRRPSAMRQLNHTISIARDQRSNTSAKEAIIKEFDQVFLEANETYEYMRNYNYTLVPNVTARDILDLNRRLAYATVNLVPQTTTLHFGANGMEIISPAHDLRAKLGLEANTGFQVFTETNLSLLSIFDGNTTKPFIESNLINRSKGATNHTVRGTKPRAPSARRDREKGEHMERKEKPSEFVNKREQSKQEQGEYQEGEHEDEQYEEGEYQQGEYEEGEYEEGEYQQAEYEGEYGEYEQYYDEDGPRNVAFIFIQ